ncbi:MAG: PAS domain S-box protein, partial [Reyranella sp.]|nr:PAS domain S-box protein [Reyranella sp.]
MRVEERLRIAQEAGGVGTFEWYPETGDLDVSDEYRRIWGLAPDAPISADILVSLLHPEDRGSSGPARLERANPLEYVEYRRVDPVTGEIRWIARRGEVVSSPGVREQRFVGVAIDITERKAAEERLQRSEARWRDLFEQMQEAFFIGQAIRDPDGRMRDFTIVELNPAFEAQTGIKAADAAGQAVSAVIPGIQAELIETYERVVDTGEPAEFEVHIPVLGDRWYEARARRSGPDQFAVLFVDITQRKAVEQAISESEARFRTLAQSMPNHVWTATADGRLDWFNDRVYAYAGAEAGALDGDGWAVMVHPDDLGGVAKAWADARAAGGPYQTEFRLLRH